MNRCPECNFAVHVEWMSCRRCGARLPEPASSEVVVPLRRRQDPPPAPPVTVPARPVTVPAATDTLLPPSRRARSGMDTLLPATVRAPRAWRDRFGHRVR
jgi:hypothetical protein